MSSNMKNKFAILITRFPFESQLGGEELHTMHLAEELVRRGHEVTVCTSDSVLFGLITNGHSKLKNITPSQDGKRTQKRTESVPVQTLQTWKTGKVTPPVTIPSLILFTLLSPLHFLYLGYYLYKFHRQVAKINRDESVNLTQKVLYCLSLPDKLLMSPIAKLLGFQVVWIEHARIGRSLTLNPWLVFYKLWARFAHIIAPSKQTAAPIKWAPHLHIIPHGTAKQSGAVCPSSAQAVMTTKIPSEAIDLKSRKNNFEVLCVARLSQDKGVDYLIFALQKLINQHHGLAPAKARNEHSMTSTTASNIHLSIVGEGREKAKLKGLINQNFLDKNVTFVDKVPHEELLKLYEKADVVVLPSSEHDPFGLTVLEAMNMNKPVVLTDVCGISEYLENGVDAIVVPPKDKNALYQAMNALLINQEFRAEIARNGHETVLKKFSFEKMVDEYERIFTLNSHC